jgi:menaquinone-dependent protoporphyrinogen oxidase
MKVLVAFASKHGATEEIARSIGEILDGQGLTVDVKRMKDVDTVLPYNAFVLGSAIYMGSWLKGARAFVDGHAELLARQPTWLFSSGPIGSPPHAAASDSFNVPDLLDATHARDHQVFGGRLDKANLGLAERALAGALRVPSGDYREWDAVTAWATAIARTLEAEAVNQPRRVGSKI